MLADLAATARLVWSASPRLLSLILLLSILLALVPAATLWVGKLLLDEVARAIAGGFPNAAEAYRRLATLLALQVGIAIGASLVQTVYSTARELLGDTLQNRISLRILHKAAALDVESFENAETYDALRNAYNEVGSRPLGVMFQVIGIGQALITLTSIGGLMARLGWEVLPLVLLASIPGVIVSSRFGAEGYRVMRRRATDARHQNYLGSILTSDSSRERSPVCSASSAICSRAGRTTTRNFARSSSACSRRRSAWGLAATLGSSLLIALATLSVLRRAANGAITVGDFSLFVGGIVQIQSQFTGLLNGVTGIYESLLYMRNLFEFLELPSRNLDEGDEWRGPIESIEFERVSFRYPLTDRDVLSDVSFAITKGPGARARRRERRGQDDGRQAGDPPVRADRGPHSAERPRRDTVQSAQRAARDEHHLSGLRPVSDDRSRKHRAEPHGQVARRRGDSAGERKIRSGRRGERSARALRDDAGPIVPGRPAALGRTMAAARARPAVLPSRVGSDFRRADGGARRDRRSRDDRPAARARPGPHHAADLASILDRAHGRKDHRAPRRHASSRPASHRELLAKGGIYATLFNLQARGYQACKLSE